MGASPTAAGSSFQVENDHPGKAATQWIVTSAGAMTPAPGHGVTAAAGASGHLPAALRAAGRIVENSSELQNTRVPVFVREFSSMTMTSSPAFIGVFIRESSRMTTA